jgi:hypothetical protein
MVVDSVELVSHDAAKMRRFIGTYSQAPMVIGAQTGSPRPADTQIEASRIAGAVHPDEVTRTGSRTDKHAGPLPPRDYALNRSISVSSIWPSSVKL